MNKNSTYEYLYSGTRVEVMRNSVLAANKEGVTEQGTSRDEAGSNQIPRRHPPYLYCRGNACAICENIEADAGTMEVRCCIAREALKWRPCRPEKETSMPQMECITLELPTRLRIQCLGHMKTDPVPPLHPLSANDV